MRLLVLGGGGFLGYHFVAEALAAGHEVTTFSRDEGSPLAGVTALVGDRQGDLSALESREWDFVIDTFSDPEAVLRTARLLSGRAGSYGFVSGISNYHPDGPEVVGEHSPLRRAGELADDPLQKRSLAKLRCEAAVAEGFEGKVFILRPGVMVGPRDPTDRFTWWPLRLARAALSGEGVEVLAPGDPDRPVQYTDTRDLAAWTVAALAGGLEGIFNGVGPGSHVRLGEVLEACQSAVRDELGASKELVWAGEDFLRERLEELQIEEEARPLWFPEDQIPFSAVDSSRAREAGLRFRSAYQTARDTLQWARQEGRWQEPRAGFSPEVERRLISDWRAVGG